MDFRYFINLCGAYGIYIYDVICFAFFAPRVLLDDSSKKPTLFNINRRKISDVLKHGSINKCMCALFSYGMQTKNTFASFKEPFDSLRDSYALRNLHLP